MESLKNQIVKMNLSVKIEKGLLFLLNLFSNYSEEEQVIGTWIDGKPIYRKVSNIQIPTSNSFYIDLSSYFPNVETLVNATPIIDFTDFDGRKMFGNTLETYCISFSFNDNTVGMMCRNFDDSNNQNFAYANSIIVILEYTKIDETESK